MPPQSPLKCIILIMNIEHMNKFHRNPGSEYETILKILKNTMGRIKNGQESSR